MSAHIPGGKATVNVSIISPNRVLGVPASAFLTPEIKGTTYNDTPCLSFLIEHKDPDGKVSRLLFDLGIRKDWLNSPPAVVEAIQKMDIQITTDQDPVDQLEQHGVSPEMIESVVFSHWHFDHLGDLNRFPRSTKAVVGPGFKQHMLPGYPVDSSSFVDGGCFADREVHEVCFDAGIEIGCLKAVDWFQDGSLYLLSTPGHAVGHMSALARTTVSNSSKDDTFILLAGDVCHHAGELRPSAEQQLPSLHERYLQVHPFQCKDAPYYTAAAGGFNMDAEEMRKTVGKVQQLDNEPNVFTLLSHDNWLLSHVDLFPKQANAWKSRGWDQSTKWSFLQDFELDPENAKSAMT